MVIEAGVGGMKALCSQTQAPVRGPLRNRGTGGRGHFLTEELVEYVSL